VASAYLRYDPGVKFDYTEFDGEHRHLPPDALFPDNKVMRFILQWGDDALDAMQQLQEQDSDEGDYIRMLIEAGLLEQYTDEDGNKRLRLSPKMLKGIQHRSLMEMFEKMKRGAREGHPTPERGRTTERADGTKAYEFGDPISELALGQTMRNAVARQVAERANATGVAAGGPSLPIRINTGDFVIHETEGSADCATVMLIDLSGSMMRYGRFYQAKRVALGMQAMIRQRFPLDTLDYVGFYSLADVLKEGDVPLVMPKPVSIHDYEVKLRVPLNQAREHQDRLPLHFTNLQLGLRQARQILSRRGAANKQIFVITDGQPTAHVEPAGGGADSEMLYLLYPPAERTAVATLKEAARCQQMGIRIATFALIEDYWGMDWVGFVDRLTRLTRGIAYYCTSEDLSSTVIESYLKGRKSKTFVQ